MGLFGFSILNFNLQNIFLEYTKFYDITAILSRRTQNTTSFYLKTSVNLSNINLGKIWGFLIKISDS